MKKAQKVAEENWKQEICVTCDLVIAIIGLQLQVEKAPKFDNAFAVLGSLHIKIATFTIFGKYIAESGSPDILNECLIIGKSFISGKGCKWTKRAHQLLRLAIEVLHFYLF